MTKRTYGILTFAFAGLLLAGVLAFPPEASAQKKRGAVIRLKDFKIVGRIQKPQAFYVLHRAPLNYKSLKFKESFVKKVINAVKKAPF